MGEAGKKILGIIGGSIAGMIVVIMFLTLANETDLIIYTENRFQIFLMMAFILFVTAVFTEAIICSNAMEHIINLVIILLISLAWGFLPFELFEFAGARSFLEYLTIFIWPVGGAAIAFAIISQKVYKKLKS